MNTFTSMLKTCTEAKAQALLFRDRIDHVQVNIGNVCNQQCVHCHVDAGPDGKKIMSRSVAVAIITFLKKSSVSVLDITGGAPELSPVFNYLVSTARPLVDDLIVRSNLTALFEVNTNRFIDFYSEHNVHLVCSLPCYLEENVNSQRGSNVFSKSIEALKLLNKRGYGTEPSYQLDLVYNPTGAILPPQQEVLEEQYKNVLKDQHGIYFNKLITITNVPIARFATSLKENDQFDSYLDLLKQNFNCAIVDKVMCRSFVSIGYDGKLYDCDFNQALGWHLTDKEDKPLFIHSVSVDDLVHRPIILGDHCLSCTAGTGSSCSGALEK